MKILLVLPAADRYRVTRERPVVPRREMLRFSVLPLTTVAALTPPGHTVVLCDENVEPLDLDAYPDVDLVGVTFMTALAPRAFTIARAFRARGIRVVAGGYHPTLRPDECAAHFDAVVAGDAEGAWPRLVADAAAGRPLAKVYRGGASDGLGDVPVPREDVAAHLARHYATVHAVQTGRGCRHGCRYCSIAAFHRRAHRSRPLPAVLDQVRRAPRDFIFIDDNLIADPDYARLLFHAMVPMRKRWVAQASILIADDPELLYLARAAGCRGLFVGVESISEAGLRSLDKGFNGADRLAARIAAIRRAGIGVIAGMIVGTDADDAGVFRRTLDFLRRAGVDAVQLNILTPLPGTPLYGDFARAGRVVDRDWSHYDFRHVVFRPARMPAESLQAGADWIYAQFYRLDRILGRFAKGLFTLGPAAAWMGLRLGLTYRYDNRREGIVGRDPERSAGRRGSVPPPAAVKETRTAVPV